MSDSTPGDGEVLSPEEYLREHGADGVTTIRHQYDPASSLMARDEELDGDAESLRRKNELLVRTVESVVKERDALKLELAETRENLSAAEQEHDSVRCSLRLAEQMAGAQMSAILHTVGGLVEGAPTLSINYLQRLRELVAKEAERDAALEHNRHLTRDLAAWKKLAEVLRARLAALEATNG